MAISLAGKSEPATRGLALLGPVLDAELPTYHALAIGVSGYEHWNDLPSAEGEAQKLAAVLKQQYGFVRVDELYGRQATRAAMLGRLRQMASTAGTNDALLVYYSGHGHFDELTQTGYWIPQEASVPAAGQAPPTDQWVNTLEVVRMLTGSKARHVLVVADSCFSGTLAFRDDPSGRSKLPDWAARALRSRSRNALTSGAKEKVPATSVFAANLLGYLERTGEDLFTASDLFGAIRKRVEEQAKTKPLYAPLEATVEGNLEGEFVFVRIEAVRREREKREAATQRKKTAMDLLADAYKAQRTVLTASLLGEVEGALEKLNAQPLEELLTQIEGQLKEPTRARAQAFVGWWNSFGKQLAGLGEPVSTPMVQPTVKTAPVVASSPKLNVAASKENPYENSLGMKFVPVPGTTVLFSIWETRRQDYEAYAAQKIIVDSTWRNPLFNSRPLNQAPDHPVTCVSWDDAGKFCRWLTETERAAGRLSPELEYRLPTVAEWHRAAGVKDSTYYWGDEWPPRDGAGNLPDRTFMGRFPGWDGIASYDDGYAGTAPAGSFDANLHGIHDMVGNVREWCQDKDPDPMMFGARLTCGADWQLGGKQLEEAFQPGSAGGHPTTPSARVPSLGFRCVLAPVAGRK